MCRVSKISQEHSYSCIKDSVLAQEWNNGAFTYSLIRGLRSGKADANKDGEITVSELQAYVLKTVPELTKGQQRPTFRQENLDNDFRLW